MIAVGLGLVLVGYAAVYAGVESLQGRKMSIWDALTGAAGTPTDHPAGSGASEGDTATGGPTSGRGKSSGKSGILAMAGAGSGAGSAGRLGTGGGGGRGKSSGGRVGKPSNVIGGSSASAGARSGAGGTGGGGGGKSSGGGGGKSSGGYGKSSGGSSSFYSPKGAGVRMGQAWNNHVVGLIADEFGPAFLRADNGVYARKISGSSTPSQHSFGNAADLYGQSPADTARIAAWLDKNRKKLNINTLCWDGSGPSYDSCTTAHTGHIHIDFGEGMSSVNAAGLWTKEAWKKLVRAQKEKQRDKRRARKDKDAAAKGGAASFFGKLKPLGSGGGKLGGALGLSGSGGGKLGGALGLSGSGGGGGGKSSAGGSAKVPRGSGAGSSSSSFGAALGLAGAGGGGGAHHKPKPRHGSARKRGPVGPRKGQRR